MAEPTAQEPQAGSLDETPLAELLVRLDLERFAGTLELVAGNRTHIVVLDAGRVVKAQLAVPVEPLGRILVDRGLIDATRLDALLASQPAPGHRLGQLLVAQGLVDAAALDSALVEQVRRRLLRLFLAGSGTFRLLPGQDALDARPGLARPFDPLGLLPEGVRNSVSAEFLAQRLYAALEGRVATVGAPDACARLGFSPAEQSACRYLSRGAWDAAVFDAVPAEHKPTLLVTAYCLLVARALVLAAPSYRPAAEVGADDADQTLLKEILGLHAAVKQRTFFELLGVPEDIGKAALNDRYLELVKRYHPDRAMRHGLTEYKAQLEEILLAIREAFETLVDPALRDAYLAKLHGKKDEQAAADVRDVVDRAVAAERAYQLAVVLERQHKLDEAQKSADEALELAPEQGEYVCMSLWLQATRRPLKTSVNDLVARMTEAAARVGKHERALLQAGRLLQRAGRAHEAVDCFHRVLKLNPQNVEAARDIRLIEMRSPKQAPASSGGLFGKLLGRKEK
jgi:curved DNA-binding protein CbpA